MSTIREDFEALLPKVGFCRVGDAVGGCAVMLGQPEEAMLYTADQVREAMKAVAERCAVICDRLVFAIDNGGHQYRRERTASHCAAAIRAQTGGAG